MAKRSKKAEQGAFTFVGWGGKRPDAGRAARSARSSVPHGEREGFSRHVPIHVTLRLRRGLPSLREKAFFDVALAALSLSAFGLFFRIVEFSVQGNHLHLIIEAADAASLTIGIKSFTVRFAKALNRKLGRHGPVFADRFHTHVLRTPREVRHALLYVLGNARKHATEAGRILPPDWIDPRSSGPWFRGWADADPRQMLETPKPVAHAKTWLLSIGWLKHGRPLSTRESSASNGGKALTAAAEPVSVG